ACYTATTCENRAKVKFFCFTPNLQRRHVPKAQAVRLYHIKPAFKYSALFERGCIDTSNRWRASIVYANPVIAVKKQGLINAIKKVYTGPPMGGYVSVLPL